MGVVAVSAVRWEGERDFSTELGGLRGQVKRLRGDMREGAADLRGAALDGLLLKGSIDTVSVGDFVGKPKETTSFVVCFDVL